MESIVKFLEKGQPYFDKVSKNIYLQAIKDGFLAAMPIILSSSVFLLISTLPGVVATVGGFTLPDWWNVDVVNFCNKVYNFTMGVVGIMVAGTTASALTGSKNRRMPAGKAINATSTMVAAMCAMLILAVTQTSAKIDGADVSVFFTDNMGTKGLLSSFVAAFATVNIYAFCIKRDITIKLPKEVPGAIAQNFRDIFAFSFSILFVAVIDVICRTCLAVPFANVISTLVSPLFAAADSYAGLALIWFMIPLFWFMGIHGPSVVKPALNAALFGNITTNLATLQAGGHPALALTENFGNYIGELGGTGATFIVPIIFLLFMRSKQLKAVGKASVVPVMFAVNEPLLFAAPIVLNPVFFVPFVFAPIANIWILKIFIDFLGMNGFMYTLPWTVPGPIGTIMGLGFQPLAFVMLALILVVDFVLYYPFFRAYDAQKCAEEAEISQEELAAKNAEKAAKLNDAFQGKADAKSVAAGAAAEAVKADAPAASAAPAAEATTASDLNGKRVLVLCQGGGTSGLLANALAKAAKERGIDLETAAEAYGNHADMLPDFDLVVLAPQAASYLADLQKDCERVGNKCVACRGKQYIELSQNGDKSLAFVSEQLSK